MKQPNDPSVCKLPPALLVEVMLDIGDIEGATLLLENCKGSCLGTFSDGEKAQLTRLSEELTSLREREQKRGKGSVVSFEHPLMLSMRRMLDLAEEHRARLWIEAFKTCRTIQLDGLRPGFMLAERDYSTGVTVLDALMVNPDDGSREPVKITIPDSSAECIGYHLVSQYK